MVDRGHGDIVLFVCLQHIHISVEQRLSHLASRRPIGVDYANADRPIEFIGWTTRTSMIASTIAM